MTAFAARLAERRAAVVGSLAGAAGALLGAIGRSGPGIAGPALCAYGVWEIYQPAGFITAGVILWLFDRQMPDRRSRR